MIVMEFVLVLRIIDVLCWLLMWTRMIIMLSWFLYGMIMWLFCSCICGQFLFFWSWSFLVWKVRVVVGFRCASSSLRIFAVL